MTTEPKSCRRATELISMSLDRPLTRRERLALRLHLLVCGPCRIFRRQLLALRSFLREAGTPRLPTSYLSATLSPEAQERIRRALERAAGEG